MPTKLVPDELFFGMTRCNCDWIDFHPSGITFAVTYPIKCYPTLRKSRRDITHVEISSPSGTSNLTGDFIYMDIKVGCIDDFNESSVFIRFKSGDGKKALDSGQLGVDGEFLKNICGRMSRGQVALRYLSALGLGLGPVSSVPVSLDVSTQYDQSDITPPAASSGIRIRNDNWEIAEDDYIDVPSVSTYTTERSVGDFDGPFSPPSSVSSPEPSGRASSPINIDPPSPRMDPPNVRAPPRTMSRNQIVELIKKTIMELSNSRPEFRYQPYAMGRLRDPRNRRVPIGPYHSGFVSTPIVMRSQAQTEHLNIEVVRHIQAHLSVDDHRFITDQLPDSNN